MGHLCRAAHLGRFRLEIVKVNGEKMATKSKGDCVLLNDSEWKFIRNTEARKTLRARWETYRRWGLVYRKKRKTLGEVNLFDLVDELKRELLRPEQELYLAEMSERLYVKEDWLAELFARLLLEKGDLDQAP